MHNSNQMANATLAELIKNATAASSDDFLRFAETVELRFGDFSIWRINKLVCFVLQNLF